MSCLRFATARALFETFPGSGAKRLASPSTDPSPIDFLNALSSTGQTSRRRDVLCLSAAAARGGVVGVRMRADATGEILPW